MNNIEELQAIGVIVGLVNAALAAFSAAANFLMLGVMLLQQ
jgi:hypothetical protein